MLSRFLPALVLLSASCSPVVAAPSAGERAVLPSEARQAMLQRHNEWRLHAGVRPLTWSDEMARAAGQWALQLERGRGQPCEAQPAGTGRTPVVAANSAVNQQRQGRQARDLGRQVGGEVRCHMHAVEGALALLEHGQPGL